jgi:hypothetical protein
VVASGVAVASLVIPSAAIAGTRGIATTKDPSAVAATYLQSQLGGDNHDHFTITFDGTEFADDGETADAVLSIVASGTSSQVAKRATKWLKSDVANYAGTSPNVYPGAAAKLLLVAEARHLNPTKFGGLDLVQAINDDEGAGPGTSTGEYENPSDTSYRSLLSQAFAVLALSNQGDGDGPSADAVAFLAGQQCDDGGFQPIIREDTSDACDAEDIDATSYAIQALLAAGHHGGVADALNYLYDAQNHNGAWGEQPGDKSNSNSTSIAIEALVASHQDYTDPLTWLQKRQLRCEAKPAKRGAVAYDTDPVFSKAKAIRATSQAGVALAGKSLAQVDVTGALPATLPLACSKHHKKH